MLKENPEDFLVEEITNIETKSEGKYLYAKITKTNLNTLDVVSILQKTLKLQRKYISFAGTKDKRAITSQYFSIQNIKKEQLSKIQNKNLKIEFVGYADIPLSLGCLEANRFTITVNFMPRTLKFMPNYFGEQRFSKNNEQVGKAIVVKDFKKAAELIEHPIVVQTLKDNPRDFIGAIKKLDKKLISLYINSYQSYLWNMVLKEYIKKTLDETTYTEYESLIFPKIRIDNIKIPLVSFDTEFENKTIKDIYTKILEKEKIKLRDFIIKQFPDQLPITTERDAIIEVRDFNWKENKLTFTLPKGSYATILIKQIESSN